MKTTTLRYLLSITCLLILAGTTRSHAQSSTWINGDSSIWGDATNWVNNIVASGSGSVASFSNELAAAVQVDLESPRTIGGLKFVSGFGTYTISDSTNDANVLTLAGPTKPVISVPATTTATIRRTVVAGTDGFIVDGGGTLAFFKQAFSNAPANTITGGVILTNNSTLAAQEGNVDDNPFDLAFDSLGSITFYGDGANGSTFNTLSDASTGPSYGTVDNNLIVPAGQVGTIILSPRTGGSSGDNSAAIGTGYGGTLTGGGTFNVLSRYVRGNVVGDWSAFTGQINITPGSAAADNQFRFGNPAGFPNASVDLGGSTALAFRYYRVLTVNTNILIGALSGANSTATLLGSDTAGFTLFYEVNAKHTSVTDSSTFAGSIVNGTGPAGLIKRGLGTLILTGNNTHTGPTVIASGLLQIGDGSSETGSPGNGTIIITNNGALTVTRGGTLTIPGNIIGTGGLTNIGVAGSVVTLTGTNTFTGPTHIASGKLVFGTASRSATPVTVADGASLGVRVTSLGGRLTNMNNVTFGTGSPLDFDMSGFGNPPVGVSVATNRGTLTFGGGNVTVNIDGTNFQTGDVTLLTYTNRSGAGSFVLGTLPSNISGATLSDDTVNRRLVLNINSVFYPPDPTLGYVGDAAGIWDIDNTANNIWVELRTGIVTNYYDGAPARIADNATGTNLITLAALISPNGITVSNSVRPFKISDPINGFSIAGFGGLTKLGTNKLTMVNLNNTFSGLIEINEGTLEVGDGDNSGSLGSGAISNNAALILNSGGLNTGVGVTLPNAIHGSGTVTQINTNATGIATISGNNTYTGGLVVKPGTTIAYNSGNAAGIGGGLRVESGTVALGANPAGNIGGITIIDNATFTAGANRVVETPIVGTNVTITFDKTAIITLNANSQGISGIITNMGTGLLRFNSGGGNNSTGSSNALWVLATPGGFLQPRNTSVNHLGALEGVGTLSAQQTAGGINLATWSIGGLNTDTVFEGVINDGAAFAVPVFARFTALTKVGTGTLVLSNAVLAYRGATVVNGGTLALKGTSLPSESTNITVAAGAVLDVTGRADGTLTLGASTTNQALMGDGRIVGNVVLGASGRLQPGFSIGILTNTGTFTIGGVSTFELDGSSTASDRLVATTINYGGTLVLTNIGGVPFGVRTYQLFSAGTINPGAGFTVVTQAIPNVTWDLSQLNANGSITLTGPSVNPNPTNITAQVIGNTLDLSWPESHIGWTLQTNASSIADSGAWFAYPGSDSIRQVILGIDPTKTNVFYRLRLVP